MRENQTRGSILVVDDEDEIVQFVRDALEDEGEIRALDRRHGECEKRAHFRLVALPSASDESD